MAALAARGAVAYGLASVLLLTPLAALIALRLPLQPPALALGLAVFCCVPTTLSSGIALTSAVGGNAALALLLTLATNIAGVFTIPLVLPALLGGAGAAVQLSPADLLQQLVGLVLVPTMIGASARQVRGFQCGAARVTKPKADRAFLCCCELCVKRFPACQRRPVQQATGSC